MMKADKKYLDIQTPDEYAERMDWSEDSVNWSIFNQLVTDMKIKYFLPPPRDYVNGGIAPDMNVLFADVMCVLCDNNRYYIIARHENMFRDANDKPLKDVSFDLQDKYHLRDTMIIHRGFFDSDSQSQSDFTMYMCIFTKECLDIMCDFSLLDFDTNDALARQYYDAIYNCKDSMFFMRSYVI